MRRRSQVRHRPEPIQATQIKLSKDGLDLLDLIFPISIFQWVRTISRYARNVSSASTSFSRQAPWQNASSVRRMERHIANALQKLVDLGLGPRGSFADVSP